jgi:Ca-activated chloride channel family protein
VLFVLDTTGSMQNEIDGVVAGIADFAAELGKRDLDSRIGLIAYRDRLAGEEPEVLRFQEGPFTKDHEAFAREVRGLRAGGGGDEPESTLDALGLAARQPFRAGASKVLLLITDASPRLPDKELGTVEQAAEVLRQNKVEQLHLVTNPAFRNVYEPLQKAAPGEFFPLDATSRGRESFSRVMPKVGERIAETTVKNRPTVKALQATAEFEERSLWRVVLAICLWTVVLALGASLALIVGQNYSLRRPWLTPREGLVGAGGSVAAGLVAGAAGQLLYQLAPGNWSWLEAIFRVMGWTLLGAALGGGMAFFVRNLNVVRSLAGGAVGGAVGAIGFAAASWLLGDVAGRLLGAALLGFCIGLMVALVELAFRKAWLEVVYGPREVGTVNLGEAPVTVGSDGRNVTVLARNAPPVAYRYRLTGGKVLQEDAVTGRSRAVPLGHRQTVGSLEVIVRGNAEAVEPVPTAEAADVELIPEVEAVESPDRPYPATAKTASPDPPYPDRAPAKPSAATAKPAPAAPVASADGCPGCGRKAPGVRGQRYCMVCDRTF